MSNEKTLDERLEILSKQMETVQSALLRLAVAAERIADNTQRSVVDDMRRAH